MFENMFKSGCLVRTAHVILTWLTTLVLFLHNTERIKWITLKRMCLRSGVVFAPTWQQWFTQNGFLLGAFAVTAVFSVVVLLLLCIHLYLASANSTTWEFMSRQRIVYLKHCDSEENPFDRGVICNLWHFCCVCGTVAWERIYVRRTNGAK
ncbi:probable palmitoyltransferase ZDHHC12 [Sinocyclocheilus rhinocerous]|uniref:probable palmitoyltransferase ZDHHC12 n=1 Tax=Sinocyclocheilus rhinocerous TaxID=307959 RepID=UPI0007B8DE07|nr:PREDICTED: probable palmitoyltransferase ZDHHC12 [Sinocyclocheilus rhinocerous]